MKGFFDISLDEPKPKKIPKKREVFHSCETCELYKKCTSPKMKPYGSGKKDIMIVIDPPTAKSDRVGNLMVGEIKSTISMLLTHAGLTTDDVYITPAIQCRHIKPNKSTIPACRSRLKNLIRGLQPKAIVALGATALDILFGETESIGLVERWDGWEIPYHEFSCVVLPSYGIQDYIKEKEDHVLGLRMKAQVLKALSVEYVDYRKNIHIKHIDDAPAETLISLENASYVAFDYETTGLQPYKEGHSVCVMGVSDGKVSYVFQVKPEHHDAIRRFLKSDVPKIAQNAKFEGIWSKKVFGVNINNLVADTMLDTHILNNTKGIAGLKFQAFVNFGIIGYEDEISGYIKAKGIHDFNMLEHILNNRGIAYKIKDYCALDSLFTVWLYEKHLLQFTEHTRKGSQLFLDATKAFIDIELNGIRIDEEALQENVAILDKQLEELHNIIYNTKEVTQWDKHTKFNFTSNTDLPHLIYDILKYPVISTTNAGYSSVDEDTLEKLLDIRDREFLKALLKYRKLEKIKTTYLIGLHNNMCEGIIHPSFNLFGVPTFRSSCSNPNFQNIPKRAELAKRYVRSIFIAEAGTMIEELDFSSLEVNIGECYHHDKNMYKYLTDTSSSMHTDVGMMLFLRTENELRKEERNLAKGGYVFPVFYGSNAITCAKNIWADMDKITKEHLKQKGYSSLEEFTKLVQSVDYDFWNVRFKEYSKWKEKNWEQYQKTGYIDFYTGFRTFKPMSPMQAGNIAIQGSSFHCLLWLLIYTHNRIKKMRMRSKIIGQIHDSMVVCLYPEEADIFHGIIQEGLYQLKKEWDWINIPLKMEYEQTPVNGKWSELKEAGVISV